jgi:hypothetical protein
VKTIAAEGHGRVGDFRGASPETFFVGRSAVNLKHPQHQYFISEGLQVVELRFDAEFGGGRILLVGAFPEDRFLRRPSRTFEKVLVLAVAPGAPGLKSSQAVNPFSTKRIVKDCAPISGTEGFHRLGPMNSIC